MNSNVFVATDADGEDKSYVFAPHGLPPYNGHIPTAPVFETWPPRVDVRLDYENLHLALWNKKNGCQPDVKALVPVIKRAVKTLGVLVRVVAYADWQTLSYQYPRRLRGDWQRGLAELGVETRYLVNINGKNTVDMRIANDVRDLMERNINSPDAADVIVLGTNDRDFRPLLETARRRRRRVVLLAVKDLLSKHLLEVVDASDVYYIGKDLRLYHNHIVLADGNGNSSSPDSGNAANGP